MREISAERSATLSKLVGEIDSSRQQGSNLSSAIRLFVLDHFKARAVGQLRGARPHESVSVRA